MPALYVLQGPDKGRTIKTSDDVVLIGRGSEQVPLADQTVSRRHAELRCESGVWVLSDLHSANGTYVNGVRTERPVRLKHGDQIKVGATLMLYTGDDGIEQVSGSNIPSDLVRLDAGNEQMNSSVVASIASSDDSVIMAAPQTAAAARSWQVMVELTRVIGSLVTPERLLPRVMDILLDEVVFDRGVIFLRDEAAGEMLPEVVRFQSRKARAEANREAIVASRTILDHVVKTREAVLCSNVSGDDRFREGKSVFNLGMRSVICAPIVARDQILGMIHLDCPTSRHTYTEDELKLVSAIGYQTGLAIENARLVQAQVARERMAAAGETAAHLSHSIKNILQGMRSGGDLVQRGLDKRDFGITSQGWRILDRNLDKCYTLMMNMLAFSKQREPVLEPTQIRTLVDEVIELEQKPASDAGIVLLAEHAGPIPEIPLDPDGMHQALLNLVANSLEAVPRSEGVIRVRTSFDPLTQHAVISIRDNGPGIPEDQREKIFEPFHSTKGHGGTGLGLAVCRKIIGEHGGTIEATGPSDGGAEFVIRLPTAEARRVTPGETQAPRG